MSLQDTEIAKLMNQLKALVDLKKEHEETLLVKFNELLNSKKSKIRELNQALEAASSKTTIPEPVDIKEETPPPAAAAAGPSKKRANPAKAAPKATTRKRKLVAPPSDSESDGFVKMEVDSKGKSVAVAPANGDETEDSEDFGVGEKRSDYLRQNELGQSDRSATEDEDELPPVRRPFEAFTLRAADKRTPEPEAEGAEGAEDAEAEAEPKPAGRGGRGGRGRARGRGKGKERAPPASSTSPPPASTRGRGRGRMATRSKPPPKEPSMSPAEDAGTGDDTDDDEL